MIFRRPFSILVSALLLLGTTHTLAKSDQLVLRAYVFPTVQIAIAGGGFNGQLNSSNYRVNSNMSANAYKIYQETQVNEDSSNKIRQLVVEAN